MNNKDLIAGFTRNFHETFFNQILFGNWHVLSVALTLLFRNVYYSILNNIRDAMVSIKPKISVCSSTKILRTCVIFVGTVLSLYTVQFYYFHIKIHKFHENNTLHFGTHGISTEQNMRDETQPGNSDLTTVLILKETIKVLNDLGQASNSSKRLEELMEEQLEKIDEVVFHNAVDELRKIKAKPNKTHFSLPLPTKETNITVAVLVCGDRKEQALIMLKSAVMFSLDVNLHVVVVSDLDTISDVGQDLLSIKLGLYEIGYRGFTYELVLEWYPHDPSGPDWKSMYRKCATQRLFLPNMLPHHDATIYLDTDVLVIGNLTEMWDIFRTQMKDEKMLGVTPNSESLGYYRNSGPLPFYGEHGINAGIMLLNLTQMRQFNFEARVKAIHTAFDKIIYLADQDIINVFAHGYPGKILDITCAYNFYWIHCNNPFAKCYEQNGTINCCFCNAALKTGVRILHGNTYTFYYTNSDYPFIRDTFTAFRDLDLSSDSYSLMFESLRSLFNDLKPSPCPPLTADVLYGKADAFLKQMKL